MATIINVVEQAVHALDNTALHIAHVITSSLYIVDGNYLIDYLDR